MKEGKREILGSLFINTTRANNSDYLKGSISVSVADLKALAVDSEGKVRINMVGFYKEKPSKDKKTGEDILVKYYYLCKDVPLTDVQKADLAANKATAAKTFVKADSPDSPF